MKILAFDFSSEQRSVAVVQADDQRTREGVKEFGVVEQGGRSMKAIGMIEEVLRQAKLEREQIEYLAVGLGPGSYTGIRAAIALAQGWQLARGVRLAGISSADALAAQAHAQGWRGRIATVIDAQRGEFYLARYEIALEQWRVIEPLRLAHHHEVQVCQSNGECLIGPEVTKWFPEGKRVFPSALLVGRLALAKGEFDPGDNLEPIYLRQTTFVKAPPPRFPLA